MPVLLFTLGMALAPAAPRVQSTIDLSDWGSVTAPVYGSTEAAPYGSAELFAGPHKFGPRYFDGVLPNGRIVRPAGITTQVGMNPLGAVLTRDGKYLITSNDNERDGGLASLINPTNVGGYSLTVINTAAMQVVSQVSTDGLFIGLQVTGQGPYTVWASGGPSQSVKLFSISPGGAISGPTESITIPPLLPSTAGYVTNYTPAAFAAKDSDGNLPPVPTGFDRKNGAAITFPAGSSLSPDGGFLYVACNGDNSLAVLDTKSTRVVKQVSAGYFPYGVAVSSTGSVIAVANWGVTEYRFKKPAYDAATGALLSIAPAASNQPAGFYVPETSTAGEYPRTSSVSLFHGRDLSARPSVYLGCPLDELAQVGDTHPSAVAIVRRAEVEVLYVARTNDDSLGLIQLGPDRRLPDLDLSPVRFSLSQDRRRGHRLVGAYPNAIAVAPDNRRVYVAEAGINAVAVLETTDPARPRLLGWIPTGWYPAALCVSSDGGTLYVANARGIGEDLKPAAVPGGSQPRKKKPHTDSNFIFGTVQKVTLAALHLDAAATLGGNFAVHPPIDTTVVPAGGAASRRIKHVFFILHENKTFDSMLGNHPEHFGPYAATQFKTVDGALLSDIQYTGVAWNTQLLALKFGAAVNYYSDAEESDAGHQFCASGTASDYTEKTLSVKKGRGLLANKNFDPEDYPAGGYLFNNAARNGVTFKDYGALLRIAGADTAASVPTLLDDPPSGRAGYPQLQPDRRTVASPLVNRGDVDSPTRGLGQSYFLALPVLAVLGGENGNHEPRLDRNYPGYNFNLSDQRRALEFCKDFDRMVRRDTLPQFIYIYQPNDHTGTVKAPNQPEVGATAPQQVADGDVALGMVVQHIMQSQVYYDPVSGEGSALFITYDDAQSTLDHIHPHRTPLVVVSPYAKPGFVGARHYSSASIVKTEELVLGLPPNNLGDLFATDLRDLFQPTYNGITADQLAFSHAVPASSTPEGRRIWALVDGLDTSAPDRDSDRLGALARLSMRADALHAATERVRRRESDRDRDEQAALYRTALRIVNAPPTWDADD